MKGLQEGHWGQRQTGKVSLQRIQMLGHFKPLFCSQSQRWGGIQQETGPQRTLL